MVNEIIFVVQRFPGYGGAEEYVFQLSKRIAEQGVKCAIFTSDMDRRRVAGLPASIKVVRFPVILKFGEYALWRGLSKALLKSSADVFHINTYGYFHSDLVSLLHGLKSFNTILTSHGFHGLDAFINRHRNRGRSLMVSARPLYDFTLGFREVRSADALIALSEHDVEIFKWMRAQLGKIHEISLGVKDVFFGSGDEEVKTNLRKKFFGEPIILSVGELSWVKGKDIPLRALASLVKFYPKAKLIYVGRDGGMYAYLRGLAAGLGLEHNVLFEGYVPSDSLVNYYAVADVVVHTSYAEGLSTIILEAIASGIPVVSTPAGGNAQLLGKSKAGLVVPFNDPQAVCLAVQKILNDKSFKQLLSVNARRYAVENLKWSEIALKYISLYRSLLKGR